MTRNQNHDDDDVPWSDVNHDVLLLVIMQLGVVDFIAFSGVCKSWRSLALSIKNTFMASKPPMGIWSTHDGYCYLEDFKGRRFKSILPHSAGRICLGVTCGYLIMFGMETHDFWLVNPITRHQLHFPSLIRTREVDIRAILVFSRSISQSVFVVLHRRISHLSKPKLSFYIDGKKGGIMSPPLSPFLICFFFKGKIYTLHSDHSLGDRSLGELRLYPNRERKWMLLEAKNFLKQYLYDPELVSSGENLYLISRNSNSKKVMEVDIGEMKWVLPQKTIEEYAFFISNYKKSSAAMKLESWAGPQTRFESYGHFLNDDKSLKCMFYYKGMWYFPHDCLSVNILDEW